MPRRRIPQPAERVARRYRRTHERYDREPVGRYERSGFRSPEGFVGAYAERPEYWLPRGMLYPPEPEGSGWPHPRYSLPPHYEARHLRAVRDRDLARAVSTALFEVLPPWEADHISVFADDAVITLAGRIDRASWARAAVEAALRVPGVRKVYDELDPRRPLRPRSMRRRPAWRAPAAPRGGRRRGRP